MAKNRFHCLKLKIVGRSPGHLHRNLLTFPGFLKCLVPFLERVGALRLPYPYPDRSLSSGDAFFFSSSCRLWVGDLSRGLPARQKQTCWHLVTP